MTLHLDRLTSEAVRLAKLADIAEAFLSRQPAQFRHNLQRVDRDAIRAALKSLSDAVGWTIPNLAGEWLAIEEALDTSDSDACWIARDRTLSLDLPGGLPDEPDEGAFLAGYADGLFTGLFQIGEHVSGDRAFVNLLPDADEIPVFTTRHESGDLQAARALKTYLIDVALSENDPEAEGPPGWVGSSDYMHNLHILDEYDSGIALQTRKCIALYDRSRWTSGVLWGSSSPKVAKYLALSPNLDEWEQEKAAGFDSEPFRLNYWLVAHTLLGNTQDAAEAVQRAVNSRAEATRWLGVLTSRILAGDGNAQLGRLWAGDLLGVRKAMRDAAPASMFRTPGIRA